MGLKELLKVETGKRDDRRSGAQATVHQNLHAIDMEKRQHRDQALVGPDLRRRQRLRDVGDQIAMGEHDAFGEPCGTRGVRQSHDIIRPDRYCLGQRDAEQARKRLGALDLTEHVNLFDPRSRARRGGSGHQWRGGHQDPGA